MAKSTGVKVLWTAMKPCSERSAWLAGASQATLEKMAEQVEKQFTHGEAGYAAALIRALPPAHASHCTLRFCST